LVPKTVHRDAVLGSLSPEQRPVAEQVLKGGIPAVRQALATENDKAKAEGRPEINPQPLLAMAEELLPVHKAAAWRDRAEAAAAAVEEISLRDLRSVVTSADQGTRDDESRLLARTLREALERRVEERRQSWVGEIQTNLESNRVVRALRLSARPPDPGIRFPADLALRLAEAASAAMTPDVAPDRWVVLLEAVAASPVRRNVHPVGLPAEPGEDLTKAARQAAGLVPALASLLGLSMPPPPTPTRAPGARTPSARPPQRRPAPGRRATPVPKQSAPSGSEPSPAGGPEPAAPVPEPITAAEPTQVLSEPMSVAELPAVDSPDTGDRTALPGEEPPAQAGPEPGPAE
jgi:hypothetical protein